ncbi:MAG: triphosphoribosyl-dephospho-CoA synthetase [Planctomycetaceae bacterium]|nr:triphosphoribosyl-dephospho-CoA synthetase [Planctomycetaceae bacterium]
MPISDQTTQQFTIGQCATLACLLESTTPKPGNVHRGADFEDMTFTDFVATAVAIGPVMETASVDRCVGATVLEAVRASGRVTRANTNLGTVLLFAPLAVVSRDTSVVKELPEVLARLSPQDASDVYEAIRLAGASGLGRVSEHDVHGRAPADLLDAMKVASPRDLIARQYVTDFHEVFQVTVPSIVQGLASGWSLPDSIIHTHVRLMARFPDSLIVRKCGEEVGTTASLRARAVLDAGQPGDQAYHTGLEDLDFWLRSDGHRRNPGTTADLIAAGLFVGLREDLIIPPFS